MFRCWTSLMATLGSNDRSWSCLLKLKACVHTCRKALFNVQFLVFHAKYTTQLGILATFSHPVHLHLHISWWETSIVDIDTITEVDIIWITYWGITNNLFYAYWSALLRSDLSLFHKIFFKYNLRMSTNTRTLEQLHNGKIDFKKEYRLWIGEVKILQVDYIATNQFSFLGVKERGCIQSSPGPIDLKVHTCLCNSKYEDMCPTF